MPSTSALTLNGGKYSIGGGNTTAGYSQEFASLTLGNSGTSYISVTPAGSGQIGVTTFDTLTRNATAGLMVLSSTAAAIGSSQAQVVFKNPPSLTNGILPWLTVGTSTTNYYFGTVNPTTGSLSAATPSITSSSNSFPSVSIAGTDNVNITSGTLPLAATLSTPGTTTVNSLCLGFGAVGSSAQPTTTLTLGSSSTLVLKSGGLLLDGVGSSVTGGTLTAGDGTNPVELHVAFGNTGSNNYAGIGSNAAGSRDRDHRQWRQQSHLGARHPDHGRRCFDHSGQRREDLHRQHHH